MIGEKEAQELHESIGKALECLTDGSGDFTTEFLSEADTLLRRARELASIVVSDEDPMYGRCDTCGVRCDEEGCTANRRHVTAISSDAPRTLWTISAVYALPTVVEPDDSADVAFVVANGEGMFGVIERGYDGRFPGAEPGDWPVTP